MRSFARGLFAALLALALLASAGAAHASGKHGKKIPKDKIPETVRVNYGRAFGKAPIVSCYESDLDGKTVYRIVSKQDKRKVKLLYTMGGVLEEMVEPLADAQIPLPVIGSVAARFPRGKILSAQRITRGKTVLYAVTVRQLHQDYVEAYGPQGDVQEPAWAAGK